MYSFRFDEMIQPDTGGSSPKSAVLLSNTKYDWLFLNSANMQLKGVAVIFGKDWLDNFLGENGSAEDIKKYMLLKMSPFTYDPLDGEYRRLMNELIQGAGDKRFELLVVYNRIMLLIERFFTRISVKINDAHFNVKVSAEDITRLKRAEEEIEARQRDFRAIFDGASDGMLILNSNWVYTDVNPAATRIFGLSADGMQYLSLRRRPRSFYTRHSDGSHG